MVNYQPGIGKTFGRQVDLKPYVRRMPGIPNLTLTLDTEIVCTLCRGTKLNIVPSRGFYHYQACANCHGTGKMKSRTSEEDYNIRRAPRK